MKKIASCHFDAVELDRSQYGGFYRIPAVAKGAQPEILIIKDEKQTWQTVVSQGKQVRRETILDREIALDCIRMWTQNRLGVSPTCHPGIWLVRDEFPLVDEQGRPQVDADKKQQFRPATQEEYDQMFAEDMAAALAADAEWADLMIAQADEWWNSPNPKDRRFISNHYKLAAVHRGKDRDWLKSGAASDVKTCPACGKMVPIIAWKCAFCTEIIDAAAAAAHKKGVKEAMEAATPATFGCSDCGKAFRTQKELVQHRVQRTDCKRDEATVLPQSA